MYTAAFYDTKPYDKKWFDKLKGDYKIDIRYFESRLTPDTAVLAKGCDSVVAFVSDDLGKNTMEALKNIGIRTVAMRCAGLNNVDLQSAGDMRIYHVPAYSPSAVAEHAVALLLCVNRKIHKAWSRTRDHNFSLKGLVGFGLKGKTVGVVGTGKVGRAFIDICRGFGMKVIAYDAYPDKNFDVEYTDFRDLCRRAHVISLHCPLLKDTRHMIDKKALDIMQSGVYIINTSRGGLIDSDALLDAVQSGKVGGAGLDVYEEETEFFYEDVSDKVFTDEVLDVLLSQPNVIVTSHQAFLTEEALEAIARETLASLAADRDGKDSPNMVRRDAALKG